MIQPRVQDVGPEHFGIVAVDCAKARSKWLLANFYGTLLVEPTTVEHQRVSFELAVTQLKEAIKRHAIKDVIVCIEMTGTYLKPVQRAFRKAGFETRIVHPFASSHYRILAFGGRCSMTGWRNVSKSSNWREIWRHSWCGLRTCCCSLIPASTSSAPRSWLAKQGRSRTTLRLVRSVVERDYSIAISK